jgi:hypothetical protein
MRNFSEENLGAFFAARRAAKNRAFRGFRRASGAAPSDPSNPGRMGEQRFCFSKIVTSPLAHKIHVLYGKLTV